MLEAEDAPSTQRLTYRTLSAVLLTWPIAQFSMSAFVKDFGCRPVATVGLAPFSPNADGGHVLGHAAAKIPQSCHGMRKREGRRVGITFRVYCVVPVGLPEVPLHT